MIGLLYNFNTGVPKVLVNLTYENYKSILNIFIVRWVQIREKNRHIHSRQKPVGSRSLGIVECVVCLETHFVRRRRWS
ncbi:Hypothetical predicted protein [Octopus vulgaris]|uniref:Uncharacterized protein n=1 Tax=Octopus vulgaris TaxID=6645 RepID=A0AA36BLE2_OCTVU|nr:Hypothetical predicted protein [Octopus vulgaris]